MPEVPTVEIVSPKDGSKWLINLADFDESVHIRWGESAPRADAPDPEVAAEEPETEEPAEPSVEDFVTDASGAEWVNIINPENRRSRLQIPAEEYNPDEHRVWSSHPRFHQR